MASQIMDSVTLVPEEEEEGEEEEGVDGYAART